MQIQKGKNAVCRPINMSRKKVTLMVESKFILGHIVSNRRDLHAECDD